MPSTRRRLASVLLLSATALPACGSDGDGTEVLRSYDVDLEIDDSNADKYDYVLVGDLPDFTVGDEVTFVMSNTGALPHDLQVVAPDGDVVGVAPAVNADDTLELTVFLGQSGIYRLNCLVDNHLTEHDMQNLIQVDPAET